MAVFAPPGRPARPRGRGQDEESAAMSPPFRNATGCHRPWSGTPTRDPGRRIPLRACVILLTLLPVAARGASLTVEDGPIVLGQTEQAMVLLQVEEPAGTEDQPVRLAVNVGSFGPVERVGPGGHRGRYTPPAARH